MKQQSGFTVIELVLFVAISGLMAATLLIGTSIAIQRQQYRDSVQSYVSFLRGQYDRVVSVQNDRLSGQACPISGSDAAASARGQSNCIILGRYIATVGEVDSVDGKRYAARSVYGLESESGWRYAMGEVDTTYELSWSARTRFSDQSADSAQMAILMYRDPDNGSIIIRANPGRYNTENIGDFFVGQTDAGLVGDSQFEAREVCVYDTGWMAGERQSVFLGSRAGSGDAITTGSASEGCGDA